MTEFEMITSARKILELSESATMEEIKQHFKKLMKKWHPDNCLEKPDTCEKMARKVIEANRIILEYCNNYRFSFTREAVERNASEDSWWLQRFGDDPIWG